jgi:Tfp pilus assembly protein PilV
MPSFTQKLIVIHELEGQPKGFILLEVLIAMGLVATSWMALGNTYQYQILRLGQLQEQREQIKKEVDQHEILVFTSTHSSNTSTASRKSENESIGMSRRSRPVSSVGRTINKK